MVMVGVDDSSLKADLWPKSVGLVWAWALFCTVLHSSDKQNNSRNGSDMMTTPVPGITVTIIIITHANRVGQRG